jgi:hypothetical protein
MRMTGGPFPARSKAMVVPSAEVTVSMGGLLEATQRLDIRAWAT